MLSEREYRIKCINTNFPKMQYRNIVVYGTGINAKLIINYLGKTLNIIGLMDKGHTGEVLYGYKILSEDEVVALGTDTIIIAAQIDSAIAIYRRIHDFCTEHNFEIFDLYGNNVQDLMQSVIEFDASYDTLLNSNIHIYNSIKCMIDASDVISFNLGEMFTDSLTEPELFRKVWESQFCYGTKAFIELRQKIGDLQTNSYGNMESIYSVLQNYLCLSEGKADILRETELDLRKYNQINRSIKELISYIQKNNKKIYLINESIFPESFWIDVLKDNGIKVDIITLLNKAELRYNKYNGLYREIIENEPDKRYLHIGSNYDKDGIAASVYGIRSVVVKNKSDNSISDNEQNDINLAERVREYCTDNIGYTLSDSKYDGFLRLDIGDQYCAIVSKDAEIKPGWLEQLVSTAEKNREATIICSRVSKGDGTCIYAGEIIKEETVVQQAKMVSGFLPEYDYVRQTGQISLIAFLVKKHEWDESEKNSTELKDAFCYYINTGKQTAIYQPFSEVVYKQSDCIAGSLFKEIVIANRPKILVTDNLMTQYDHDAGSRCTWFYLNQFHKLGFDVTFMAQNFEEIQPYVMYIQQTGIRVIYGSYYREKWETWLIGENDSFRYVYMQRPDSTAYFIGAIKKFCHSAKLFYFTHDLHFLRLFREYEITGDPEKLKASEDIKAQECALIEAADVVHVVGSFEKEYLQQMYPGKKIRNIPLYIYNPTSKDQGEKYKASDRKDLLYVGSFGHTPNRDAAIWFADHILPMIVERFPDIVWHVVGANPPAEVQIYQGKNVVLHGFLSDDDLTKLYSSCRIVVVPLRYGAGVKGKIVEASYHQIPIVTTPIGAEGIPQDEGNMIVCNSAEDFADTVCELYQDEERLNSMSKGGRRLVEKYYSEAAVKKVLSMDMPELKAVE